MLGKIASSSILIIAVLIIRAVFQKKISPVLLYSMWFIVAVRLILPGTVGTSPISIMNTEIWNWGSAMLKEEQDRQYDEYREQKYAKHIEALMQTVNAGEPSDSLQRAEIKEGPEAAGDIAAGTENKEEQSYELKRRPAPTLFGKITDCAKAFWIGGMLILSVVFLWKNLSFYKYLRLTRKKIKDIKAVGRRIPVYVVDDRLSSPCLFGLEPAVYIPGGSSLQEQEKKGLLTCVLEHELTHYRHGDHIWVFVRILCLIINWYNPLVYAAARLSERDGELACDAGSIRRLGADKKYAYGEALLEMIKPAEKKEELFKYATMMTSEKNFMKKRIEKIAESRKKSVFPAAVFVALMLFCAGCTYTGNEKEEKEITVSAQTAQVQATPAAADEAEVPAGENGELRYGGKAIILKGGNASTDLYENLKDKFLILTPGSDAVKGNGEGKAMLINSNLYVSDLKGNFTKLQNIFHSSAEKEILEILNYNMDLNLEEIEICDYDSFTARIDAAGDSFVDAKENVIYGKSIYVEEENDYLLCFEWTEEISRVHELLYGDSSYQASEAVKELDLKMKEQTEKVISDMRSDAGKIFGLYCLYVGKSPFMVSVLEGDFARAVEKANKEVEEAWNSIAVKVSGIELAEGEGKAVYEINLIFDDSGIIGFPEYTEDNPVLLERFLYLVKKEGGWYVDGPLHNNLPATEWWMSEKIEWQSYDFGFSDEDDLGVTVSSQEEFDAFTSDVRKKAADKLRFNPNRYY